MGNLHSAMSPEHLLPFSLISRNEYLPLSLFHFIIFFSVVVEICIRNSSSVLLDISGIDFSWICCHVTRAGRVFVIFINFKFWWSDLISFIGRKVWNLLYLIKFWYSVCVINNAFDNAASAAADARASSEYLAFSLMNLKY